MKNTLIIQATTKHTFNYLQAVFFAENSYLSKAITGKCEDLYTISLPYEDEDENIMDMLIQSIKNALKGCIYFLKYSFDSADDSHDYQLYSYKENILLNYFPKFENDKIDDIIETIEQPFSIQKMAEKVKNIRKYIETVVIEYTAIYSDSLLEDVDGEDALKNFVEENFKSGFKNTENIELTEMETEVSVIGFDTDEKAVEYTVEVSLEGKAEISLEHFSPKTDTLNRLIEEKTKLIREKIEMFSCQSHLSEDSFDVHETNLEEIISEEMKKFIPVSFQFNGAIGEEWEIQTFVKHYGNYVNGCRRCVVLPVGTTKEAVQIMANILSKEVEKSEFNSKAHFVGYYPEDSFKGSYAEIRKLGLKY